MIEFDFSKCGLKETELSAAGNAVTKARHKIAEERAAKTVGWWDLPFQSILRPFDRLRAQDERILSRFENLIVLGIGGSSQGLKALAQALLPKEKLSRLFVVESPDPRTVASLLKTVKPETACLNVISKSGETIETLTLYEHLKPLFKKEQIVVTTEEGNGKLYQAVQKEGFAFLPIPKNAVGRFSVFSNVGLFPLAFLGVDVASLLKGARNAVEETAYKNGLVHYLLNKNHGKTISVMMPYADCLFEFGRWYAQLWAESLGKNGQGQTPLAALGPQDQHSLAQLFLDGPKDKVVTLLTINGGTNDALGALLVKEAKATAQALHEKKCPCITINLHDLSPQTLGELLMTYQIQTAFVGHLMGINPYDQPAVELIKGKIQS